MKPLNIKLVEQKIPSRLKNWSKAQEYLVLNSVIEELTALKGVSYYQSLAETLHYLASVQTQKGEKTKTISFLRDAYQVQLWTGALLNPLSKQRINGRKKRTKCIRKQLHSNL